MSVNLSIPDAARILQIDGVKVLSVRLALKKSTMMI
jgi:hypothetical protein